MKQNRILRLTAVAVGLVLIIGWNLWTTESVLALEKRSNVIYFPLSGSPDLGRVDVTLERSPSLNREARNLAETVLKRDESGLLAGLFIREVFIIPENVAVVDIGLRPEATRAAGVLEEYQVIWALVNTISLNLDGIKAVKILVEGDEYPTLFGHVDLSCPLYPQPNPVPNPNR